MEPDQRGDPESPLRWTTKSLRNLADQLTRQGHRVGRDTVAALLRAEGFALQGTSRTLEGARHPDRDAQFRYINERLKEYLSAGEPVVSVDAKKKEVLGNYAVIGREWHRAGCPPLVRAHDFPEKDAARAVPYGIYDLAADAGWVSVGCDADTAAFALSTGLDVTVCHFPPGTSKWNKIEHRLFSLISVNWRGRPLTSHEVVVALIGATSTSTGLRMTAEFDPASYPTGVVVSDQVMDSLPITAHEWHGEWNYTLRPEPPAPLPEPRLTLRDQPEDRAPAWLRHPTLTCMNSVQFAQLLADVERYLLEHPPISLSDRSARQRILRRGPLSLSDRLLVTLLRQRWNTQVQALTTLFGIHQSAVTDAVREFTPILTVLGHPTPRAPIKAPSAADLARLVGNNEGQSPK